MEYLVVQESYHIYRGYCKCAVCGRVVNQVKCLPWDRLLVEQDIYRVLVFRIGGIPCLNSFD